jgi:hypothetical protein
MSTNRTDVAFKVISIVSAIIIVPTFSWVWSTQSRLERMETEQTRIQQEMQVIRDNSTDIQIIKRDIEHITTNLKEIKDLLTDMRKEKP